MIPWRGGQTETGDEYVLVDDVVAMLRKWAVEARALGGTITGENLAGCFDHQADKLAVESIERAEARRPRAQA